MNGRAERLCAAMAWTFPAALLCTGVTLVIDPVSGIGAGRRSPGWPEAARADGPVLCAIGALGVAGWGWAVRERRPGRGEDR